MLEPLARAVSESPFAGKVYAVGGWVRDRLLGLGDSADLDLVVEGDAPALAQWLYQSGTASAPPATYTNFGTASLIVGSARVELVTARRESYRGDSRKPESEPATLLEDVQRRDFTVNALLVPLASTGEVVDLLGQGLDDLSARVLRTPLDPVKTFEDDPLRMLRAVRFAHRLGFTYAPGLREAIEANAHRMEILSPERIRGELMTMLGQGSPERALADLMDLGLLSQFWPEFREGVGVEQGQYHHLDVWGHTLAVVAAAKPDPWLRLGCLFHDVGKPATRTIQADGRTRFFRHEEVGAEMTGDMMRRLRFSHDETAVVSKLVRNHMRLGFGVLSDTAVRRLVRDMGDDLSLLLDLCDADAKGLKAGVRALDIGVVRTRIEAVAAATPAPALGSPLDGDEIMGLIGGGPGRRVGEAKAALGDEVVAGRIAPGDKAAARSFLSAWTAANSPSENA